MGLVEETSPFSKIVDGLFWMAKLLKVEPIKSHAKEGNKFDGLSNLMVTICFM